MKISHETIEGSNRASDKMKLIVELIETARTRTRLTLEMSYEGDAFIKDDISMSLDKYSLQFRKLRQQLIDLGLTENERKIMLAIDESIVPALSQQRQAAQMALSNDIEDIKKAQKVMIQNVYPLQRKIIDNFMSLLNYQKNIIFESREKASVQYKKSYKLQSTIFIIILLSALMVAFYVIRRSFIIEKELFLEKEKAEITLRSVGDAIITTNKDGMVDYLNPVAEKLTGYITHDIVGKPITEIYKAYDQTNERWLADCIMNYLKHGSYNMPSNDIILYDSNDELIDISQTIAPIQDTNDNVLGTITTFQDISKEKLLAKRIEHQAQHDALTGLLNRREFENKVEQSLILYSEGTTHALCVMDLDRFKIVNDTLGHTAGDELLKQISAKIQKLLRKTDLFARIGGDEFALFLSNIDQSKAEEIVEKILNEVREYQFVWGNKAFRIGASIGLVDAPAQVSNYENLYHAADTACYMAKHEGRDRFHTVTYDDKNVTEKREQTQWVNRINDALSENRFTLYCQDIIPLHNDRNLKTHKEVLIRMLDKDDKIIPPMAFIPPAERYNLMPQLDDWVIKNVLKQLEADTTASIYAVNLSGQSLADNKFTQRTIETLKNKQVQHQRLCFEITETSAIANLQNATEFLSQLQELGCYTALDDFGSGLSSFGYLRSLPINYLKIDGMFIKQIVEDETSRVMVEAINSIGHTMNLKTIAEFVEDKAISDLLKDMGVDYAQGYYYGKPQPM
ncbi:MAG: EAL domain-containing protein [Gammaproteobacteria bacterium]|nr:EAL domain-containing protein [Gammaproteobacteria bacterium]